MSIEEMSTTVSPPGGDVTQTPSTFSYAQAAKGQAASSVNSPAAKPDSFNWAEDSAETVIVTEDTQSSTKSHAPSSKSSDFEQSLSRPSPNDDKSESLHLASEDFVMVTSTTTGKVANMFAEPKSPLDNNAWESKSQSSNDIASAPSGNEERNRSKEKPSKEKGIEEIEEKGIEEIEEKVADKPLKEAPIPTVNFWQQRAQEAKAKQNNNLSQTKTASPIGASQPLRAGSTGAIPSQTNLSKTSDKLQSQKLSTSSRRETNDHPEADDTRSAGPAGVQGSKASRNHKQDSPATDLDPPPPVRDVVSWPTPLSAQDEDRRKAQEKGDKVEKERTLPAAPKTHGKNEWKAVAYTPSVKFNTPLPPTRGRGGRLGLRGGRGGAHGDRTVVHPAVIPTEDAPSDSKGKEGNDVSSSISPSASSSVRHVTSTNKEVSNNSIAPEVDVAKDNVSNGMTGNDLTSVVETSVTRHRDGQAARSTFEPAPPAGTDKPAWTESKPKSEQPVSDNYITRRRGTAPYESVGDGTSAPRPKRRTSQTVARETLGGEGKDRRRSMLENGSGAEKGSWVEVKGDMNNHTRERDANKEAWTLGTHRERGDARPERGRGGGWKNNRGNHAQTSHYSMAQNNNGSHLPPIQTGPTHPHTKGTLSFPQQYSQSMSFPSNTRGGYRNSSRSASTPSEASFGRYAPGYPNGYQYGFSPYVNGMYDFGAVPNLGTAQYSPFYDPVLFNEVAAQLSYYFSLENMIKDLFLRKFMDSQGFVALNLVANFKRMEELTTDLELIKYICMHSDDFELRVGLDGKDRIRKRGDWAKWIMPMEERDTSARNDGPADMSGVLTAYSAIFPPPPQQYHNTAFQTQGREFHSPSFSGAASSFSPLPMNSSANGFHSPSPTLNGIHTNELAETNDVRRMISSSPQQTPSPRPAEEQDSHTDDQTQYLKVVVRPLSGEPSDNVTSSEGTSTPNLNGSNKVPETQIFEVHHARPLSRQDEHTLGERAQELPGTTRNSMSPSALSGITAVNSTGFFWIKENEMEQLLPLPENAECVPYKDLHQRAIQQRGDSAQGHTPYDMLVLYNFWSHFLVRNFNTGMYLEFRELAREDVSSNSTKIGMQRLADYYAKAFSSQQNMPGNVARDYVELLKQERSKEFRPAFNLLSTAWRNVTTSPINRRQISDLVGIELRQELDSQ